MESLCNNINNYLNIFKNYISLPHLSSDNSSEQLNSTKEPFLKTEQHESFSNLKSCQTTSQNNLQITIDNIPADNIPVDNIPVDNIPVDNISLDNISLDNISANNQINNIKNIIGTQPKNIHENIESKPDMNNSIEYFNNKFSKDDYTYSLSELFKSTVHDSNTDYQQLIE